MTCAITNVKYHRNGISGDPFYAVLFESDIGELIACVPADIFRDDGELRASAKKQSPPCYVLQTNEIGQAGVRGDHFFEPVCEAIKEWSNDGRAFGLAKTKGAANSSEEDGSNDLATVSAPSGERSRPSTLTVEAGNANR